VRLKDPLYRKERRNTKEMEPKKVLGALERCGRKGFEKEKGCLSG